MYRQYENPFELEDQLAEARARLEEAYQSGDEADIESAAQDVAELEDRVRFAWDDDEYDNNYDDRF